MDLTIPINVGDYLPKYLSAESTDVLLEELKSFPINGTGRTFYTSRLKEEKIIFQGDGITGMPFYDTQSQKVYATQGIILSNTCDMDTHNRRLEDIHLCFAPLLRLSKYHERLSKKYDAEKIRQHLESVKRQKISHLLYLPQGDGLEYDAIVPLDRICHVQNSFIDREKLDKGRLFTLSDYGNYMFLLKISIHFTRIRERIDRNKGVILT